MRRHVRVATVATVVGGLTAGLAARQVVVTGGGGAGGQGIRMVTSDLSTGPVTATSTTPLPTGTGLIYGQAVEGTTTRPVGGALVTLVFTGFAPVRVIADGEGRFTFRDVPKGRFTLGATKSGYDEGAYGRLRPGGPSQPIDLADGQQITDANIPLWKMGAIAGIVLDEAGAPIPGAPIRLLQRTLVGGEWRLTPLGTTVTTDDRGMYRISLLNPGTYVVVIPMASETPAIRLLAGAGLDGVRDALAGMAGGAMGGAVQFRAASTDGGSSFSFQTSFQTLGGPGIGPAGMTDDGALLWYPTTFFPSAAAGSRATPVVLGPGEEKSGVDFSLKPARTFQVSGMLTGANGPATNLSVSLFPAEAEGVVTPIETATTVTNGDGQFVFDRVPPGQYTLRAVQQPRIAMPDGTPTVVQSQGMIVQTMVVTSTGSPPLPTDPTMWIETGVSVADTNVTDLGLTLHSGLRVNGHIEFNGGAAPPPSDQWSAISLSVVPADARTEAATRAVRGRIDASGLFTTMGVPDGRYVLRVGAPAGWTLRAATYNGNDISDVPVEIRSGDIDGVTITYTDKPSSLAGTVTSSTGSPDPKAAVIIFPENSSLWTATGPSPRRIKNVRAGQNGAYSTSLPAGDYLAVAVSDSDATDWNDPRFLDAVAHLATHVTVGDGERKMQALHTVAAPKLDGGGL